MLALLALACNSGTDSLASLPTPPMSAMAPATAQDPNGVVATWKGGSLTYKEVQADIQNELAALEIEYLQNRYQLESSAVSEAALMKVLEAEAATRSMTVEELLKVEVEDKVALPSQAEIEAFYPVVQRQLRNAPLEAVQDQVAMALLQRRQGERMGAYIEEIQASYEIQTQLPYPDMPRLDVSVDDDPALGSADAVVTIVEFADYQCGYCRKVYPTLLELQEQYGADKLQIVYRDYPLSGGSGGLEPSIAANCAGAQGKYWEMHDELMRNTNYTDVALKAYGRAAGLEPEAFAACLAAPEAQLPEIMNDFQAGRDLGVSGTPAFFINGIPVSGAVPKEQFQTIIDAELAEKG
jgi:protein-disulfide isomerase